MNAEEVLDSLDSDTVLRVRFGGHTDHYVYRFPSGIMVAVWGDRSVSGSVTLLKENHVEKVLGMGGVEGWSLIPFNDSPYAEGWEGEP